MIEHRVALEFAVGRLRSFDDVDTTAVDRLVRYLDRATDADLVHINPYQCESLGHLDPDDRARLALKAASCGLLELWFNTLSVFCGAVEWRFEDESALPEASFHCTQCEADIGVRAGQRIEVAFRPHRSVSTLKFNPFESSAAYRKYFVSPSIVPSREFSAYLLRAQRGFALLKPGDSQRFSLLLPPERTLKLLSYDLHLTTPVRPTDSGHGPSLVELRVSQLRSGLAPTSLSPIDGADPARLEQVKSPADRVSATVELRVQNDTMLPTGLYLMDDDSDAYHHALDAQPPERRPFFDLARLRSLRAEGQTVS
jgi:hypothetical protein